MEHFFRYQKARQICLKLELALYTQPPPNQKVYFNGCYIELMLSIENIFVCSGVRNNNERVLHSTNLTKYFLYTGHGEVGVTLFELIFI